VGLASSFHFLESGFEIWGNLSGVEICHDVFDARVFLKSIA